MQVKYFTPIGIAIILLGLYPLNGIFVQALQAFHLDLLEIAMIPMGGLAMFAAWGRIVSLFVCGECSKIFLLEYHLRMHFSKHVRKDT